MNEKEIKFIDLFGGIGGFRCGLEKASGKRNQESRPDSANIDRKSPTQGRSKPTFNCVWYCDKDKYSVQTYNKNFGENHKPTDITTVNPDTIPDFDMLCAGFPCQSFSVAGKRGGFSDTRGSMFFEIARILETKRPEIVFLENVKGLLNHDEGETFKVILQTLGELGYGIEWMVLNSKFFGVPQNRERVFIIGHLRGTSRPKILPIGKINEVPEPENGSEQEGGERVQSQVSPTTDGRYGSLRNAGEPYIVHNVYGGFNEGVREFKNHSPTIRTPKGGGHLPMVAQRTPLRFLSRNQKNIEGDYSFTIDSANTGGVSYKNKIRRLTPVECERLQGFPDNWTDGVSDTQRYKQCGNAVTVNVIEAIGTKMLSNL